MFKGKKSKDENYIEMSNLPILILDANWLFYFAKGKNEEIELAEADLRQLLKDQARVKEDTKKLGAEKKKLLSQILALSDDLRKGKASVKTEIDAKQSRVTQINDSLSQLEQETASLPEKIKKANNRLLQICIKTSYNKVNKNNKELKKYEENIKKFEQQLSAETDKKNKLEKTIKNSGNLPKTANKDIKYLKKCEENIAKFKAQLSAETEKKDKFEASFKKNKDFLITYIGEEGIKHLDEKYKGSI